MNAALPGEGGQYGVSTRRWLPDDDTLYYNTSNPNGLSSPPYLDKTYHGTPVSILEQLLADGYPVWSINSPANHLLNTSINNLIGGSGSTYSRVGNWFNACVAHPRYNHTLYPRPNFSKGFEGWVEANNWLIRTFSPVGHVTFGWQDNMWAVSSSYWLHKDLTAAAISTAYSKPLSAWLNKNAPSTIMRTGPWGTPMSPTISCSTAMRPMTVPRPETGGTLQRAFMGQLPDGRRQGQRKVQEYPGHAVADSRIPHSLHHESQPGIIELQRHSQGPIRVQQRAGLFLRGRQSQSHALNNIIPRNRAPRRTRRVGNAMRWLAGSTFYNCAAGKSETGGICWPIRGSRTTSTGARTNKKLAFAAATAHVFAILWGGNRHHQRHQEFQQHRRSRAGWPARSSITTTNPVRRADLDRKQQAQAGPSLYRAVSATVPPFLIRTPRAAPRHEGRTL